MTHDKISRRPTRLAGHDYAADAQYVVTIGTQNRAQVFGTIDRGRISLSAAGDMIERWWIALPERFLGVRLDAYVVMPNHLHGIVAIRHSEDPPQSAGTAAARTHSLTEVIGWFKTMSTNEYIRRVHDAGWEPFDKRLWQRSFYDTIIRSDQHLERARAYIDANPSNWHEDTENPLNPTKTPGNDSKMT